jgi:hypothetical protein
VARVGLKQLSLDACTPRRHSWPINISRPAPPIKDHKPIQFWLGGPYPIFGAFRPQTRPAQACAIYPVCRRGCRGPSSRTAKFTHSPAAQVTEDERFIVDERRVKHGPTYSQQFTRSKMRWGIWWGMKCTINHLSY